VTAGCSDVSVADRTIFLKKEGDVFGKPNRVSTQAGREPSLARTGTGVKEQNTGFKPSTSRVQPGRGPRNPKAQRQGRFSLFLRI
jgi:hypothetical protein